MGIKGILRKYGGYVPKKAWVIPMILGMLAAWVVLAKPSFVPSTILGMRTPIIRHSLGPAKATKVAKF